jgi:mannose-6-phosphate isomerase-like protein (cupin superfamily)
MQKRTFRFKKNQKLSLALLLILTTCIELAKASNQMSYGSPAFLGDKFTGSGQMTLANAVKKLIPHDIKVLFMDVDPNTVTRWSYSDVYVLNVITDFSKKYRFNWELIDNKLLIVGQNAQLPDKSVNQGLIDLEQNSANHVALTKITSSRGDQAGKSLLVKENEPIQENKRFEIRLEDESLSLAIRRWSSENGYQLVWDVGHQAYGHKILTGRRESSRQVTEKQLSNLNIFYDKLIMGIGNGDRIIINDKKPDGIKNTAYAINVVRNQGLVHFDFNCENVTIARQDNKIISKPWGSEELIECNDKYVLKKLFMKANECCSMQYHELKRETIYVLSGKIKLYIGSEINNLKEIIMNSGDNITIEPYTIHRMEGVEDSYYLEASTNELWDVVRLNDKYNR